MQFAVCLQVSNKHLLEGTLVHTASSDRHAQSPDSWARLRKFLPSFHAVRRSDSVGACSATSLQDGGDISGRVISSVLVNRSSYHIRTFIGVPAPYQYGNGLHTKRTSYFNISHNGHDWSSTPERILEF
jgi:hypothetical protein